VATGKALDKAGLATPVFVVNWPGGGSSPGGGLLEGAAGGLAASKLLRGLPFMARLARVASMGELLALAGPTAGAGMMAGAAGLAGGAGYGTGSMIYRATDDSDFMDKVGGTIAEFLARLGSTKADDAIDLRTRADATLNRQKAGKAEVSGTIRLQIDPDGSTRVTGLRSSGGINLEVSTGPVAAGVY
jgi:hypothetical protein